ncbi:MAG: aminotransferase class I/II-fold pyridoxal phosphate-dependent enzyme [Sphingomonas adhaesiva]|uniref:aminotransferase class I/II-fold pyridoxal phosphate-dependent enzyme n=1 Tax=Sphingomonas adhaesiva TaxID=28212 RepID=UPI002FF8735D
MIADFLGHGGRIDAAMRAWPEAPRPWLDLSTGINPQPWAPPAGLTVDAAPLPSRAALAALEASAARTFGVAAERVAAVPGSEIALRLLAAMGLPRPIVAPGAGYATHRDVADAQEGAGGTLLLANPNNPDGRLIPPAGLLAMGEGRWLVVDEAFVDAQPEASVLPLVDEAAPVVVLRSFGKFFGLAGVRLGFVVAPAAILARLRGLLGDWPVSAQAIAWGAAAYADMAWIARTRETLASRARRLDALLASHGLAAVGSSPLFRLVVHDDARAIFGRLAQAGVLTRPFAGRADWLRFGLPADDAEFARLDRALADG